MILIFLLVVILSLGAAIVLGYALGVFDTLWSPGARITDSIETEGAADPTSDLGPGNSTDQVPAASPTLPATAATTVPPTDTSAPTPTPIFTPTATVPVTPPADVCSRLDLRFLSATSNIAAWRLENSSGVAVTLGSIEIDWPATNEAIFNAFVDGKVLWSGQELTSPTSIYLWIGERSDRTITSLSRLEFFFGTSAAENGYQLTLRFENGCVLTHSQ